MLLIFCFFYCDLQRWTSVLESKRLVECLNGHLVLLLPTAPLLYQTPGFCKLPQICELINFVNIFSLLTELCATPIATIAKKLEEMFSKLHSGNAFFRIHIALEHLKKLG